ncbi:hypothetical protein ASPWEDRAFT_501110 [Aspergillus wentii DTO 134E9]|uniref:Uncharacterized protein n=1 Tax=Aspergillus wentii DTO 134E9 TaxID=1073089 RepID=A0A1L9RK48_ASPWE|nr:uncharacterized protein ASPWEDRAFT_501110 [Aspergillus wentii DTO 134E9]OJJ35227.1 hypothetical protein ASPWEDRAFT_501110 [Aspergillus wentii DTO 134E9]
MPCFFLPSTFIHNTLPSTLRQKAQCTYTMTAWLLLALPIISQRPFPRKPSIHSQRFTLDTPSCLFPPPFTIFRRFEASHTFCLVRFHWGTRCFFAYLDVKKYPFPFFYHSPLVREHLACVSCSCSCSCLSSVSFYQIWFIDRSIERSSAFVLVFGYGEMK